MIFCCPFSPVVVRLHFNLLSIIRNRNQPVFLCRIFMGRERKFGNSWSRARFFFSRRRKIGTIVLYAWHSSRLSMCIIELCRDALWKMLKIIFRCSGIQMGIDSYISQHFYILHLHVAIHLVCWMHRKIKDRFPYVNFENGRPGISLVSS